MSIVLICLQVAGFGLRQSLEKKQRPFPALPRCLEPIGSSRRNESDSFLLYQPRPTVFRAPVREKLVCDSYSSFWTPFPEKWTLLSDSSATDAQLSAFRALPGIQIRIGKMT
jgi:hypothetical protein